MSLIDSIFGTAAADNDAVVVDTSTIVTNGSGNGGRQTSPKDANVVVSNHHSLFHTIIPIPERKLEYKKNDKMKNTKKRGTTTTASPVHQRHQSNDTNNNDDDDDDDDNIVENLTGMSVQSSNKKIKNDINDDADKNERTIFVGNIPITYTRKHLRQLFVDCGTVQSTRIRGIALPETENDTTKGSNSKKTTPEESHAKKSVIKLPPSLAGQQQIYKKVCINTSGNHLGMDTTKKQSNIGYVVFLHKDSVEKALLKNNMVVPVGPIPASSLSDSAWMSQNNTGNHVRHLRVDRCVSTAITNQNTSDNNNTTNSSQSPSLRDPKRTIFVGNLPYHTDEETLHQHILQHMKLESTETSSSPLHTNDSIIESIRIVRNPTTYVCQGFAYVLFTSIQYVPTALRMLHQTTYMKQALRIQSCKTNTKNDHAMKNKTHDVKDHPSKTNTHTSRPSITTATTTAFTSKPMTKAVGALKRVLQKQQRLLLQEKPAKNVKTIRKRGPTTSKSKHKVTKKAASSSSKKKK